MTLLITGTASGIGKAVADHFIQRGHTVYGIDTACSESRENFLGFVADITSETSLEQAKTHLHKNGIRLDAILNIAGIHRMAYLVESDYAQMKKVV